MSQVMCAKNRILILLIILFTTACEKKGDELVVKKSLDRTVKPLSLKNSGYQSSVDDWKIFLSCWMDSVKNSDRNSLMSFSRTHNEILYIKPNFDAPKSLLHFYEAYQSLGVKFIDLSENEEIGFFSPEKVKKLKDYSPYILEIDKEWAIESPSSEYFVYGVEQDTSSGRYSYLSGAYVIGKFGLSDYELILLYPKSLTEDSEMETAILSHSYEFRTPGFFEMMRQVSYMETNNMELLPPYSQSELNDSCAKNLVIENQWWN